MFQDGMWIIFLEMGLVLLLGAFIVWFTWPKPRKSPPPTPARAGDDKSAVPSRGPH
jgi:hypothetical protein